MIRHNLGHSNTYLLISVRLWNLKDGGSQKVRFLAKNQHNQKLSLEKYVFNKKWSPKLIFSDEKNKSVDF